MGAPLQGWSGSNPADMAIPVFLSGLVIGSVLISFPIQRLYLRQWHFIGVWLGLFVVGWALAYVLWFTMAGWDPQTIIELQNSRQVEALLNAGAVPVTCLMIYDLIMAPVIVRNANKALNDGGTATSGHPDSV